MNYGAIILAAGGSTRMGQSKQMLDIRGQKLLPKTIGTVLQSHIDPVVVVLGASSGEHVKIIKDFPVELVQNQEWAKGMGNSLKAGLLHLIASHLALDAVIILVCDQPLLESQNIQNLISAFEESRKPVIASRYSGMPGVPALFDKSYFDKLLTLPDDQGAKKIILQNRTDVLEVDFPEGEIDLDTPEDYDTFIKTSDRQP